MKIFYNTKRLFLTLLLAVSFLFLNSIAIISNLNTNAVSSYSSSVSLENGDFTNSINSWEALSTYPTSSVNARVINVDVNDFTTKNDGLQPSVNPKTSTDITNADNYILMMKAISNNTKYGFESTSITLSKSKFYQISVHCKTGLINNENDLIDEGHASIYTSVSNLDSKNFTNINTLGLWQTYTFYVATDSFDSTSFNIQLRLGNKISSSNGAVFFDNVQVVEIANIDYFSATQNNTNIKINLDNDYETSFLNSDFENGLTGFNVECNTFNATAGASVELNSSINETIRQINGASSTIAYANNNVYGNTKSLFISNIDKAKTTVSSISSNFINIAQHGYYRLSFLVKTGNISSNGLDVTLSQIVDDESTPITVSQSNITSTSGSLDSYNGFKEVVFYIAGHSWYDSKASLSFALGSDTTTVSGYAIVDNIKFQKISQTEYSSNKSSSDTLDLASNISDTTTILNGTFDFANNLTSTISYPANPTSWTYSGTDSKSGIIRVRDNYFSSDCLGYDLVSTQNPGPNTTYSNFNGATPTKFNTYENVLMIRNQTANDIYYSSVETTLSANSSSSSSLVSFEVAIKTILNSKAFIKIVDNEGNVLGVVDNITATDWTNYTIYIKNGVSSQTIKLEIGTHSNVGNNAYAFFDFAKYTSDIEKTTTEILQTQNSAYLDLIEDSFYSSSKKLNATNVYSTANYSNFLIESGKENALYNGIYNSALNQNLKTRSDANDKNVLMLANTVASYQILKTNYTYSLTKDSYYEISVWIKTDFENCNNVENFGAYFEILTVSDDETENENENTNKFSNVVVSNVDNNGWQKYSIYIYAESDYSIKILLGLGTQEYVTKGTAYFDDLKVCDITKTEYANYEANDTTIVTSVVSASSENDQDDTTSTVPADINYWALSSSIILAVALIFAIAGYLIRRIPKKQIAKISKSKYNKSPYSIDKNAISRELKENREASLKDLKIKISDLEKQQKELETKYEKVNNLETNFETKEKMFINYTKQANKLTKEIDYLKSAVVFMTDEANIRNQEKREFKKRKTQIEEEYLKLKNQPEKVLEKKEKTSKKIRKIKL